MRVKAIFLLCLLLALSCPAYTELKTSVDITAVGMGARPIALGGAYTGLADDASAIFTNPAGLGLQNKLSFVSMSTQILTCVDYKVAGFAYPTQYGTFGVGYIGATSPAGNHTYMNGGVTVEGGPMYYTNQMLVLSYGKDVGDMLSEAIFYEGGHIKNLSTGVTIKMLSQGFSGSLKNAPSASGLQVDIGTIYMPNDSLTLGAVIQNINRGSDGSSVTWDTGEKENLPELLKIGCSYKALNNVTLNLDTTTSLNSSRALLFGSGVEWKVMPYLALRAGFDQNNESVNEEKVGVVTRYSLGVGLNYEGFGFDYAYRQDPVFNQFSTQYFSVSYSGGPIVLPVKSQSDDMVQVEEQETFVIGQAEKEETVSKPVKSRPNNTAKKVTKKKVISVIDDNMDSDSDALSNYERMINQSSAQSNVDE